MNSITKRWIKGSLLIIIILLAVAEIFLVTTFRNSYYSAAQTALTNRVNTIEGTLAAYGRMSGEEKQRLMFRLTDEFAEKESFELMLLDDTGEILATGDAYVPANYKAQIAEIPAVEGKRFLVIEWNGDACGKNHFMDSKREKINLDWYLERLRKTGIYTEWFAKQDKWD